ncbi:MAG: hypothetical protein A3H35_13415 [Betaproteobacteria bacterium RIFCSPLOWO2_02_FULL_62_17]|nr:MAG: hypothetical protein A3H35_13415 [Betaproteobacteria bacterium RIFCSPLOWO2_02_FULL_62_17]
MRRTLDEGKGGFKLTVLNPMGAFEVAQQHAPRLASLNGRTIGELGNGSWEDQVILPALREQLRRRVPDLRIIPYTEFPRGAVDIPARYSAKIEPE